MKKFFTHIMLLGLSSAILVGCGVNRNNNKGILGGSGIGGTVVKGVVTVVGIILITRLLKSVLNTVGGSNSFSSLTQDKSFMKDFNENTPLTSIAGNDISKMALQVLIAEKYKIPLQTVMSNYTGMKTAGDLATFVGQNADAKILETIK